MNKHHAENLELDPLLQLERETMQADNTDDDPVSTLFKVLKA
jgi:hypothetical protein